LPPRHPVADPRVLRVHRLHAAARRRHPITVPEQRDMVYLPRTRMATAHAQTPARRSLATTDGAPRRAGCGRRRKLISGTGLGTLAILVTAVLWGTTGTAATFAPEVSPLAMGAAALGIGGILQAVIAVPAIRREWGDLTRHRAL